MAQVLRDCSGLLWAVGLFSFFVNLLMLTGPIYMLNIYDRVLGSGSVETLVALTLLVLFLFVLMGTLDYIRGRVMAYFRATSGCGGKSRLRHGAAKPCQ